MIPLLEAQALRGRGRGAAQGRRGGTVGHAAGGAGGELLAPVFAGRKGTGPIHDARFGPRGDRGVRQGIG